MFHKNLRCGCGTRNNAGCGENVVHELNHSVSCFGSPTSYCRSAEPLPPQTVRFSGKKERIMRYVLALLAAVNMWGVVPASSEECEPGLCLASLDNAYTVGSTYTARWPQHRAEPDKTEFEFPETIAAIERNREDRERTVVMDR